MENNNSSQPPPGVSPFPGHYPQQAQQPQQPAPQQQHQQQQPPPLQLTPPPQAPHAPHSAQDPEAEKNARLRERARALKSLPRNAPVEDVALIIGMRTKEGRQEVIHDIGRDFRIVDFSHTVKEKVRAVTEEGQFLGYEPTGEFELTLKVKYLQE